MRSQFLLFFLISVSIIPPTLLLFGLLISWVFNRFEDNKSWHTVVIVGECDTGFTGVL